MPRGLKRYQQAHHLHFITFSCYQREPLLRTPAARRVLEVSLERTRVWYGFFITGYVVMPEHVHLLVSEPERGTLAVAMQMLKQVSAHELRKHVEGPALPLQSAQRQGRGTRSGSRVITISTYGAPESRRRNCATSTAIR